MEYILLKYMMISGSKGQKAVRACTIRLLNLGPAKHEESTDSECFRIAGAVLQRSNSISLRSKYFLTSTSSLLITYGVI